MKTSTSNKQTLLDCKPSEQSNDNSAYSEDDYSEEIRKNNITIKAGNFIRVFRKNIFLKFLNISAFEKNYIVSKIGPQRLTCS